MFVGYGLEDSSTVVEVTYNWDPGERYEQGSAYGHLALGVNDIYEACRKLTAKGVKVVRDPGPVNFGTTVIAFIEDPDGCKIELIEESLISPTAGRAHGGRPRKDATAGWRGPNGTGLEQGAYNGRS